MSAFVYVYEVFLIQKIQLHKKHWMIFFLFTFLHYYGKRSVLHMYVNICILTEIYNQGGKTKCLGCRLYDFSSFSSSITGSV